MNLPRAGPKLPAAAGAWAGTARFRQIVPSITAVKL
jgi:hypothetical protein